MARIFRIVAGFAASAAGRLVRLACFVFIVLLVLSNAPRYMAAGTAVLKLQVAAGVLLYTVLAAAVARYASRLGR